ncbi:hypothetical protein D1007_03897 [Hordeum vulgare]|nr:hypothetical protein D1007_03897 [Hordeum vulgare]
MFLKRGWKLFARSPGLDPEHLLQYKFDGDATLILKFLRACGVHPECCVESSSCKDYDSSSDSDDDANIFGMKQEDSYLARMVSNPGSRRWCN